ncbi:MAG: potassium channel family protein [Acidimicrobiales bacterium]
MLIRPNARQLVGVWFVFLVTLIGTAWYWLVENFGFIDALYQSVITVSTVGFGEVEPLDSSGRLFTIVLIIFGVASMVWAVGTFVEMLIDTSISRITSRRKVRTLERMSGHTIVCGYGRTGAAVARLLPSDCTVGVIALGAESAEEATEDGYVVIEGDCTHDETLVAAGIERAERVIICLSSDSDAISTVLSIKVLNPSARVVTRVNHSISTRKLQLAGADQVVSPVQMGAQRLVADSLEPSVGSFLDAALHDESVGLSIRAVVVCDLARQQSPAGIEGATGVRIIGVQDIDGQILEVAASTVLSEGQTVLAAGHRDELAKLERHMSCD